MTRPARHPQARLRRAGHVALDTGLAVLALWFISGFWGLSVGFTGRETILLGEGSVMLLRGDEHSMTTPFNTGAEFFRVSHVRWRNNYGRYLWHQFFFPIWWLGLPLTAAGAIILYRTRAARPDACRRCRYDLTGLDPGTAVCPECGTPIRPSGTITPRNAS